jgi:hypothetical protein
MLWQVSAADYQGALPFLVGSAKSGHHGGSEKETEKPIQPVAFQGR